MNYDEIRAMSLKELIELRDFVNHTVIEKQDHERRALAQQFEEMAANSGMSIEDVLGLNGKNRKGSKVAPKYRNPNNPMETWTGRGRAPLWVTDYEDQGGNRRDLEI